MQRVRTIPVSDRRRQERFVDRRCARRPGAEPRPERAHRKRRRPATSEEQRPAGRSAAATAVATLPPQPLPSTVCKFRRWVSCRRKNYQALAANQQSSPAPVRNSIPPICARPRKAADQAQADAAATARETLTATLRDVTSGASANATGDTGGQELCALRQINGTLNDVDTGRSRNPPPPAFAKPRSRPSF